MGIQTAPASGQQSSDASGGLADGDRAAITRAVRDRRLAAAVADGSLAWVLGEAFDSEHDTWIIVLLRADIEYGWRYQRYRYDAAADLLWLWGERLVFEDEVRAINPRRLRRFLTSAQYRRAPHERP